MDGSQEIIVGAGDGGASTRTRMWGPPRGIGDVRKGERVDVDVGVLGFPSRQMWWRL